MSMNIDTTNKPLNPAQRRILQTVAETERALAENLKTQIAEVSVKLAETETAFFKAREELSDARAMLDVLTTQHTSILESLKEKERLFHPLRGFPASLLAKIFTYSTEKHTCKAGSKSIAITLSQVCREWRTVSHSTPTLWQFVDIDFGHNPDPGKTATHWIQHSGDVELSISLHSGPDMSDSGVDEVMGTLIPTASRWVSLSIFTDSNGGEAKILRKLVVATPILKHFQTKSECQDSNAFPDGFLPEAPLLQTIKMIGNPWVHIPLIYPELRSLCLSGSRDAPQDFLHRVSQFPKLQELDLRISWDTDQKNPAASSFVNLTSLSLDNRATRRFGNAETPLAFTKLQELTFHSLQSTDEMQILFSFLRHLPNPRLLHRLNLINCDDGNGDVDRLDVFENALMCATALKSLSLETCRFDRRFIGRFATRRGDASRWMCPNLERLRFKSCNLITDDGLIELIDARGSASREGQGVPLAFQSVEVDDCSRIRSWNYSVISERVRQYLSV